MSLKSIDKLSFQWFYGSEEVGAVYSKLQMIDPFKTFFWLLSLNVAISDIILEQKLVATLHGRNEICLVS